MSVPVGKGHSVCVMVEVAPVTSQPAVVPEHSVVKQSPVGLELASVVILQVTRQSLTVTDNVQDDVLVI
jgi:hypothetical protein